MATRIMSAVGLVRHSGRRFLLLVCGIVALVRPVSGSSLALCEGGQTCLPPKECCAQGCCYLYAPPGAPRVPMASNDHVLSLLFVNHWYFWCFVLAIVLALLCTCSLWKRRRQLCGWDTSARHSQSEGDSAGSCYAPPQYSRCNSFHIHAPPPYTEVASKPDLYPLVFSYTDPGKGSGANYLMVQYFRNYIVQPVGSISGTSTVDSLSSSFICNANEANTLVPPPYSRAASPDLTVSFRNYLMPRSASQQVEPAGPRTTNTSTGSTEQRGGLVAAGADSFASLPGPARDDGAGGATCDLAHPAHRAKLVCKLCCSMGDLATRGPDRRPRQHPHALHKSLETCCHVTASPVRDDSVLPGDPARKVTDAVSSVGSNVSSLVNLDAASSPPRATSPTAEVRELLEQIRQLHSEGSDSGEASASGPPARHTPATYRRPSSLIGRRGKLFSKPTSSSQHQHQHQHQHQQQQQAGKAMYIPVSLTQGSTGPAAGRHLRSPASMSSAASSFLSRGRSRYCWMSKSAPTTPGAAPGSFAGGTLGDNRPLLLTEQEEDGEQNV
uniref:WW domain binding protein VOPP1 n=1 Tax=Anopheles dirus TaxID=7168 RepID=A0A182N184_9DIPT